MVALASNSFVMPALAAGIHAFLLVAVKGVDPRAKHEDDGCGLASGAGGR
jgi:hypothetical protein